MECCRQDGVTKCRFLQRNWPNVKACWRAQRLPQQRLRTQQPFHPNQPGRAHSLKSWASSQLVDQDGLQAASQPTAVQDGNDRDREGTRPAASGHPSNGAAGAGESPDLTLLPVSVCRTVTLDPEVCALPCMHLRGLDACMHACTYQPQANCTVTLPECRGVQRSGKHPPRCWRGRLPWHAAQRHKMAAQVRRTPPMLHPHLLHPHLCMCMRMRR